MTHLTLTIANYLQSPIEALLSSIRAYRQAREHNALARETIKELSKLSDKELRDIGINRGEIYTVAHTNTNLKGWV
jgi:uncharacterized protein YjiS (DUF1127 family)